MSASPWFRGRESVMNVSLRGAMFGMLVSDMVMTIKHEPRWLDENSFACLVVGACLLHIVDSIGENMPSGDDWKSCALLVLGAVAEVGTALATIAISRVMVLSVMSYNMTRVLAVTTALMPHALRAEKDLTNI